MTIQEAITKYFYTDSVPANGARIPLFGSASKPVGSDTFAKMAAKWSTFHYAECTTEASVAAKKVTISGYKLTINSCLAVRFTNAIQATNPTFEVGLTGAKPLYYGGAPLGLNVVRPNNICLLQYDGSYYNIIKIEGLEESGDDDNLYVDMGLPSGVKWAKSNIDLTQPNGFAASPYQYGCSFFSWGNVTGQNPIGTTFPNTWGNSNSSEPYVSSEGAKLTASITPPFDAARVNLGAPWRMPTRRECGELLNNNYIMYINSNGVEIDTTNDNKLVTVNGVVGIYIQSRKNGHRLFFPCSGRGRYDTVTNQKSLGGLWSSTYGASTYAIGVKYESAGVVAENSQWAQYNAFPIRPVI